MRLSILVLLATACYSAPSAIAVTVGPPLQWEGEESAAFVRSSLIDTTELDAARPPDAAQAPADLAQPDAARPPADMAQPPADAAQPPDAAQPAADMAQPPADMAKPCGGLGQACCANYACGAGACMRSANGYPAGSGLFKVRCVPAAGCGQYLLPACSFSADGVSDKWCGRDTSSGADEWLSGVTTCK